MPPECLIFLVLCGQLPYFLSMALKSAWIPWLWPVWNQVFVMIFLAVWIRRSNVMTGASWILTRFSGRGVFYRKISSLYSLLLEPLDL